MVERVPFVLVMEEQIHRHRHLEDLARQTAKYDQADLMDECYLQKKEQKEGGTELLIKQ